MASPYGGAWVWPFDTAAGRASKTESLLQTSHQASADFLLKQDDSPLEPHNYWKRQPSSCGTECWPAKPKGKCSSRPEKRRCCRQKVIKYQARPGHGDREGRVAETSGSVRSPLECAGAARRVDILVFVRGRSLRRWWADREATRRGKQVASISRKDWGKKSSECKKIGKILPLNSDIVSFNSNIFFNLTRKSLKYCLAYNHEGTCVGKNHQSNLVRKSCHNLFFR